MRSLSHYLVKIVSKHTYWPSQTSIMEHSVVDIIPARLAAIITLSIGALLLVLEAATLLGFLADEVLNMLMFGSNVYVSCF